MCYFCVCICTCVRCNRMLLKCYVFDAGKLVLISMCVFFYVELKTSTPSSHGYIYASEVSRYHSTINPASSDLTVQYIERTTQICEQWSTIMHAHSGFLIHCFARLECGKCAVRENSAGIFPIANALRWAGTDFICIFSLEQIAELIIIIIAGCPMAPMCARTPPP